MKVGINMEKEKDWMVECWGDVGITDIFYTKEEAQAYFNELKTNLDTDIYIVEKDVIKTKDNLETIVLISNINDLT